jgi:hypothetical protein
MWPRIVAGARPDASEIEFSTPVANTLSFPVSRQTDPSANSSAPSGGSPEPRRRFLMAARPVREGAASIKLDDIDIENPPPAGRSRLPARGRHVR